MRVCRGSNCDDDDRPSRPPTGYEYCKLLNLNEGDIDEKGSRCIKTCSRLLNVLNVVVIIHI